MVVDLQAAIVAGEIKKSGYPDVAKQLLKLHELKGSDPENDTVWKNSMEIIKILIVGVRIN